MDIYDVIHGHRSIRKYKPDPIPEDVIERISHAALRASSSGNMQSHSIVITTSQELRQKLFKPHFEQEMVLQAPAVVTFCSDFHRMRQWLKLSDAPDNFDNFMSFLIGAIDAVLAAQNMALAAESEGLGICYMGTTLASCSEIGEILDCPKNVVPVTGFVLGYPDESPPLRDRIPLAGVVHRETYQTYSDAAIKEIYRDREQKGWERYRSIPELRALIDGSEGSVQNLAQVYTILKYTKESHQKYSDQVWEYLKKQDYMNF